MSERSPSLAAIGAAAAVAVFLAASGVGDGGRPASASGAPGAAAPGTARPLETFGRARPTSPFPGRKPGGALSSRPHGKSAFPARKPSSGIRIDFGLGSDDLESGIRIHVEPTDVRVGETVLVTVEIDLALLREDTPVTIGTLGMDGFDLVASEEAPTASVRTSTPRGTLRFRRLVRNYLLRPVAPGRRVLGPITLEVGAERFTTDKVAVIVRDATGGLGHGAGGAGGSAAPRPDGATGASGRTSGGDLPPASGAPGTASPAPGAYGAEPIPPERRALEEASDALKGLEPSEVKKVAFVRAVLSKDRVYVGEQVTLSYYLFIAEEYGIADFGVRAEPKFDGTWSNDLLPPTRKEEFVRRLVLGRPFQVALVRRKALFATTPGPLAVPPIELAIKVAPRRFMGMRGLEEIELATAEGLLDILALPAAGRPPGMEPSSVGTITLSATSSETSLRVGEPLNLVIDLASIGNYRVTRPPAIAPGTLDGFEVYEPTTTSLDESDDLLVKGRRHVEQLLLARRAGAFTIPALELAYFDPADGAYHVARTTPFAVTVTGGPPGAGTGSAGGTATAGHGEAGLAGGSALRPLREDGVLAGTRAPFHSGAAFWSLVAAGPGLLAVVWVGQAVGVWRRRRAPARKVKRADGEALARLRTAVIPGASDGAAGLAEVHRTLLELVQAKCGERIGGWTQEEVRARLPRHGFDTGAVDRLAALVGECEVARYAPVPPTLDTARDAAARAAEVIAQLARRAA